MKFTSVYSNQVSLKHWKRLFQWGLIGIPITTLLLLATQPETQIGFHTFRDRLFNSLEEPYRYPFETSNRSPIVPLQQEIGFYQQHLRQYPDRALEQAALATAYLGMARATGKGSWYLLADQTAQKSLSLLPIDNTEALSVLSRVAEARHDFAGALRLAKQIPNPQEALPIQVTSNLATGNLKTAESAATKLVDSTLSMSAFTLLALVKTAEGDDRTALQNFQYALEAEEFGETSNSARTRTLLGRFYYERGQLELAGNLYREALRIIPNYTPALLNMAQLAMRQGNNQRAEQYYKQIAQATQNEPTVYDPLILRGQAQLQVSKGERELAEIFWKEAETQLRQGLTGSNNTSFGHRRDLARLLLERGHSQDLLEAIALMQVEVKLRRDAATLSTYAKALAQANRWQTAKTVIEEAIAIGTKDAGLFTQAAQIEQALGNPTMADRYSKQAKAIDPSFNKSAYQVMDLGIGLAS